MKNTFAVTMTLLLALTLGGSFAGYRLATTPHEAETKAVGAAGKAPEGGDPTTQKTPSEEVPSAREAASGAAGAGGALGDIMQDQAGGTQTGENGAVAAPGSESNTGTQTGPAQEGNPQDGGAQEANEASNGAASAAGTAAGQSGTGQDQGGNGAGSGQTAPAGGTGTGAGGADQSGSGAGGSGTNTTGTEGTGASGNDTSGTPRGGTGTTEAGTATASPTAAASGGTTRVGQTGASNAEKTTAADPTVSDSKAAEIASAVSGNTGEGQAKFVSTCGGCHGANAQGGVGPNLLTADGPTGWTLAQFTTTLREHRTPERELNAVMPVFGPEQLSDQDVANIYQYLKTLK